MNLSNITVEQEVEVNGLVGKVTIHPETQLLIAKGCESLYFPDNNTDFASLEIGKSKILITTQGKVKIDNNQEILYNNNIQEIRKLIDNTEDIYANDNIGILENNWISVLLGTEDEEGIMTYFEDIVYESTFKNYQDVSDVLKDFYDYLLEIEKSA